MTTITTTEIAAKAARVSRIFDVLATIVLVIGAVTAAVVAVIALGVGFSNDNIIAGFITAIIYVALTAVYTALTWASITLATIVAGYIATRSQPVTVSA